MPKSDPPSASPAADEISPAAKGSGRSPSTAEGHPRSFGAFLLAAFAGGVVAAIAVVLLELTGYLVPAEETGGADVATEIAALKGQVAELRQADAGVAPLAERVAALEESVGALADRPPAGPSDASALKDLRDRLSKLEAASGAAAPAQNLEPRLSALANDVAALKNATPPDTAAIEAALAALRKDLDALSARVASAPGEERIAGIEAKLADTSRQIETAAALAPAVAADALGAALDSGRPFANELGALQRLGIATEAVEALAPQAATGLPTLADLQTGFEAAIGSVALSTPIPENTGTIDRLLRSAQGLVQVRPAHPTAGSDPEAIVARIRGALAAGDLKTALAEWNTLPDAIKTPTADWAKAADARLKAEDLVAEVRTAALATLGAGQ